MSEINVLISTTGKWIAACVLLPASVLAQAQTCPIAISASSQSVPDDPTTTIGYQSTGYSVTKLAAPEPIPLGFDVTDTDEVHIVCGGICYPFPVPGCWSGYWSVGSYSTVRPGDFITSLATLDYQITDADHILYLPPHAALGVEQKEVFVRAELYDLCSNTGFADTPFALTFRIGIEHKADGYAIDATLFNIEPRVGLSAACTGGAGFCDLLTHHDPYLPPLVQMTEFPWNGMDMGEVRMLKAAGDDLDQLQAECGTPPGYNPVSSNFGSIGICDHLTYTWTITSGPGDGVFIAQGRSALFRATVDGDIVVRVTITASDGESAFDERLFTIVKARMKSMDWGNSQPIAMDATGATYGSPAWYDADGDGNADGPGDQRFPVAFVCGVTPVLHRWVLDCRTPAPPVAQVRGLRPSYGILAPFYGAVADDSGTASDELAATDMKGDGPVDDRFGVSESMFIDWQVSFGGDYWVSVDQSCTFPFYTVAAASTWGGPPYESLFDISCGAFQFQYANTYEDLAFPKLVATFKKLGLTRKPKDGYNVVDGTSLKLWPNAFPPPLTLDGLLSDPDGAGQSSAFVDSFRACLEIQGIPCTSIVTSAVRDANNPNSGFLVKNWTVLHPGTVPLIIGVDIVDAPGMEGQNCANPPGRMFRHTFLKYGNNYFDPSYGGDLVNTLNRFENRLIVATCDSLSSAMLQSTTVLDLQYTP